MWTSAIREDADTLADDAAALLLRLDKAGQLQAAARMSMVVDCLNVSLARRAPVAGNLHRSSRRLDSARA